jgi:hypothetical protein
MSLRMLFYLIFCVFVGWSINALAYPFTLAWWAFCIIGCCLITVVWARYIFDQNIGI